MLGLRSHMPNIRTRLPAGDPVLRYEIIDGSDDNIISPMAVRNAISDAIEGDETLTPPGLSAAPAADGRGVD